MYSIPSYVAMITDSVRVDAYARALERAITPRSFVLEIGTGIGVFAVMANRMGARRVVAIEPSDAIAVARMLAQDNGAPGIEFIQARSQDLKFDDRPDVIVSDLRGMLPIYDGHLASIIDARERLLAPGGTLIPVADTLYAAVVQRPESKPRLPARTPAGAVRLEVLKPFTSNSWERVRFAPEQMLSGPEAFATIDYRRVTSSDVSGTARLVVNREGVGEGLAVWFDASVLDDIGFSNAPDAPELVYGTAFFPWPEPLSLRIGDEIQLRIDANQVGDDYVWRWDSTIIQDPAQMVTQTAFRQSTFYGAPWVSAKLARGAAAHVATLSEDGQVERFILDAIDGVASNGDVAAQLLERFPERFPRLPAALARVGAVAKRFAIE